MSRMVHVVVVALLTGCNVDATEFSMGQFTFVPPADFEEPYWYPNSQPNVKVYFHGEEAEAAMLSVTWLKLPIDSPLSPAEEPAANDTCAQGGLEGLLKGKNKFAKRNHLQRQGPIRRVEISGVPAALIEYEALRDEHNQHGFVACIARGKESLLVTFQEPMSSGSDLEAAQEALKNVAVR